MSREGSPEFSASADGAKVAVIASAWHNQIMDSLISGAEAALAKSGIESETFRVSGAFEIPLACKVALEKFDAVVALAVVIRGDTPHFDFVCEAVTSGVNRKH